MTEAQLRAALRRAYNFGQTYWQQADSESYSQNAKSDLTAAQFFDLVNETATQMREYRNQVLEEAANVCQEHAEFPSLTPWHCSEALRNLKDK